MATVSVQRNLPWLPAGATLSILSPDIPCPDALTPSVFAVCFCDDQILLVRHNRRGWDIPGGHRETGEPFETTLHREVGENALLRIAHHRVIGPDSSQPLRGLPDRWALSLRAKNGDGDGPR